MLNETPAVTTQIETSKEGCCGGGKCSNQIDANNVANLKNIVFSTLAKSGPIVFDKVKDYLVNEEISKRTDLILKGLAKKEELEREARKIQPDPKTATYDADGRIITAASYTGDQVKIIKANRELLSKLEKALNAALSTSPVDGPDFSKLREVLNNSK